MKGDLMKTVKEFIKELKKFPDDAMTYAYEGECVGIGITTKDGRYGFIYNGESKKYKDSETETLKNNEDSIEDCDEEFEKFLKKMEKENQTLKIIVESHKQLGIIARKMNQEAYPVCNEESCSPKRMIGLAMSSVNVAREILLEAITKYNLKIKE